MKKAIYYTRISTNEDKQDMQRQLKPLDDLCNSYNYTKIAHFEDEVSGSVKTRKRVGFGRLKKFVEEYDRPNELVVIFDAVDRFGRSRDDIVMTEIQFREKGINIHVVAPDIQTLNPDGSKNFAGGILLNLLAEQAEQERLAIVHRVNTSIERTASKGLSLGGKYIAYGYKVDKETKEIVINEDEEEYVHKIFKMYIDGAGCTTIAKYLNNKNIPSKLGGRWQPNTILQTLKNEYYIGKRVVNGETYQVHRILEDDVFNKAKSIRESKSQYKNRIRKNVNPLTSLLFCGCGSVTILSKNKAIVYKCNESSKLGSCGVFLTVRQSLLLNSLTTLFDQIISKENRNDEAIDNLTKEKNDIKNFHILDLENKLTNIQGRLERISENYEDEIITKATRNKRIEKVKSDVVSYEEELDKYQDRILEIDAQIQAINDDSSVDGIVDESTLKHFCHKHIKKIVIRKIEKPEVLSEIFKHKKEVVYRVTVNEITGLEFDYLIGNYNPDKCVYIAPYEEEYYTEGTKKWIKECVKERGGLMLFSDEKREMYSVLNMKKVF